MAKEYGICDPVIYKNGQRVILLPGLGAKACEQWLSLVRTRCSEPIDWHYAGGRNNVLTTGNRDNVLRAMRDLWMSLYELFREQHIKLLGEECYSQAQVKRFLEAQSKGQI